MIIRSKAPLRLGLAGGGSDVSPYSDIYGGAILNATITMYAYATIEPLDNGQIIINAIDKGEVVEYKTQEMLPMDGSLDLLKGIYNRVVRDYTKKPLSFRLSTYVDAPPGSGLGTSSTLATAVLGAFAEWLKLPLGEYDLAQLSYFIERVDLNMAGGKQDQYAATFGGFNFMEFYADNKVIVNPLRIKEQIMDELSYNLILYYTQTSRLSSEIIKKQVKNVQEKNNASVEAMHQIKQLAITMKEALLRGELDKIGTIMNDSWEQKKRMATGITNPMIDKIYDTAMKAGASGGKISGAGGGGFMFFYCPQNSRHNVIKNLEALGGQVKRFEFCPSGLKTWVI